MDTSHTRYIDPDYAEMLHLFSRESRSHQVNTAAEPAVLGAPLFKANVTSRLQLSHQPVDVLLGDLVDFALKSFIDLLEVFQIFVLVIHAA